MQSIVFNFEVTDFGGISRLQDWSSGKYALEAHVRILIMEPLSWALDVTTSSALVHLIKGMRRSIEFVHLSLNLVQIKKPYLLCLPLLLKLTRFLVFLVWAQLRLIAIAVGHLGFGNLSQFLYPTLLLNWQPLLNNRRLSNWNLCILYTFLCSCWGNARGCWGFSLQSGCSGRWLLLLKSGWTWWGLWHCCHRSSLFLWS